MEVEQIEVREHLSRYPPFSFLEAERIDELARSVEVAYFRAGSEIVALGEKPKDLHFIRSGSVEVFRRDGQLHNRLGEGEIFSQISLITGKPARFSVRALEDSLIYFIPGELFNALFDENEEFADFIALEDPARSRQARESMSDRNELLAVRVGKLLRGEPLMVAETDSVRAAAERMAAEDAPAALVIAGAGGEAGPDAGSRPERDAIAGIVTKSDLLKRVLAAGRSHDTQVREIMSTEVVTVRDDQYLFEALLLMLRNNIHHLPVLSRLKPAGIVDLADVLAHETQSSLFVVDNIHHATSLEELRELVPNVRASFVRMVNEDANSHMIGSAMATIGRSYKQRLLELGEEKLGPPPVPYCFLALGSMARDEQLVCTDQDNGMVLDDAFESDRHDAYFRELAGWVCDGLAELGYPYCKGDIMATNSRWRRPMAAWQEQFRQWIEKPSAEALLHSSIFFDLDGVHGETRMADQLKSMIAEEASASPNFLGFLAQNAQRRTPPLGFFKDFVLEAGGRHGRSINLKRRGSAPLVDVIRVHALAAGSRSQNSFRRLEDAVAEGFLTSRMGGDLRDALEFISITRARHQARQIEAGEEPHNNIDPETLSSFDRRNLKEAFRVLSNAQKFIKFRYRPHRAR